MINCKNRKIRHDKNCARKDVHKDKIYKDAQYMSDIKAQIIYT